MEGMERKPRLNKKKAYYARKIKAAAQLLFYKHHRQPGVMGWELKRNLGSDYPNVLKILNNHLEKLNLQVKTIFEGGKPDDKPTLEQLDKARFYVTLREGATAKEPRLIGWRIDDIAGLATAIAYIIAKKGKAPREEVERILKEKLPSWRTDINLGRYIRAGYLAEDESGQLYLDWRTRAEVDEKALVDLLLGTESRKTTP
jgi:hypothetical protein